MRRLAQGGYSNAKIIAVVGVLSLTVALAMVVWLRWDLIDGFLQNNLLQRTSTAASESEGKAQPPPNKQVTSSKQVRTPSDKPGQASFSAPSGITPSGVTTPAGGGKVVQPQQSALGNEPAGAQKQLRELADQLDRIEQKLIDKRPERNEELSEAIHSVWILGMISLACNLMLVVSVGFVLWLLTQPRLMEALRRTEEEVHQVGVSVGNISNAVLATRSGVERLLAFLDEPEAREALRKRMRPDEYAFSLASRLAATPSPMRELSVVELYNEALENEDRQGEFRQKYPGQFVGTRNAQQRTRIPSLEPEFGPMDEGDFYAFGTDSSGSMYKVVPRFGRSLNRIRFEGGAWKDVFECQRYNPEAAQNVQLVSPAVFKVSNGEWVLSHRGMVLAL